MTPTLRKPALPFLLYRSVGCAGLVFTGIIIGDARFEKGFALLLLSLVCIMSSDHYNTR